MRRIALVEKSYRQSLAARTQQDINPALEVVAVNFQDYHGQLLGVIVTPWFLGLLLLPVEIEGWRDQQTGEAHKEAFPAAELEFVHGWDPVFGAFASCSLFSPMDEFSDQAAALQMAQRALQQLFVEAKVEAKVMVEDKAEMKVETVTTGQASIEEMGVGETRVEDANAETIDVEEISAEIEVDADLEPDAVPEVISQRNEPPADDASADAPLPESSTALSIGPPTGQNRPVEPVDMKRRGLLTGAFWGRK